MGNDDCTDPTMTNSPNCLLEFVTAEKKSYENNAGTGENGAANNAPLRPDVVTSDPAQSSLGSGHLTIAGLT